VTLVQHLRQQEFQLFDAQLMNPHLARFGAYPISDREYRRLLAQAVRQAPDHNKRLHRRGSGEPDVLE